MFRLLLLVHLTFLLLPQPSGAQEVGRPLPLSDRLATGDDYMGIRLLGALSLQGREALAELSDLAWDEDEGILYSVTDRGRLLHLLPVIEQDRLVNIRLLRHFDLLDETGKKLRKSERDAEGLALEQSDNGVAGDSLLATFRDLEVEGERLSESELLSMAMLLLLAGNETTTNLITNFVRLLDAFPEQAARLRATPDLTDGAVEETLRMRHLRLQPAR